MAVSNRGSGECLQAVLIPFHTDGVAQHLS